MPKGFLLDKKLMDTITDREWTLHVRQFPEFVAESVVRGKSSPAPFFTEKEILNILRGMGRYDLVYRRKKRLAELAAMKNRGKKLPRFRRATGKTPS